MQGAQSIGMFDSHFGGERSGLDIAAVFQGQQVAAVAKHGALLQFLKNGLSHNKTSLSLGCSDGRSHG
jgi:hypothetical protein